MYISYSICISINMYILKNFSSFSESYQSPSPSNCEISLMNKTSAQTWEQTGNVKEKYQIQTSSKERSPQEIGRAHLQTEQLFNIDLENK